MNFTVDEMGLSKRLGVDRSILRKIRQRELIRQLDYEVVGHAVMLTADAAQKMASLVGVPMENATPEASRAPESTAGSPDLSDTLRPASDEPGNPFEPLDDTQEPGTKNPAPLSDRPHLMDVELLLVLQSNFRNTRVVKARRCCNEEVMVQVKDATKFLPGMDVKAQWQGHGGWVCVRHPRFRGKY